MAQVTKAQVADLAEAVLTQARQLYRISALDRKSRAVITPMQLASNLNRSVTPKEVAAANKAFQLDNAATKAELSAINRTMRDAWIALIPESATPGTKLRIERLIASIVRNRQAVDVEILKKDLAALCNMTY